MTGAEFIVRVNDRVRGTDDDPPAIGSDEANYWFRLLNQKKDELYGDVTKRWRNIFESNREVGTVTSGDFSIELPDDLLIPSDVCYVIDADGHRTDYKIAQPQARDRFTREVYISGTPATLFFTNTINIGDLIVGGTLYLPGYYLPEDITANDDLPFPDPNWAVLAVAAEVAGNDIVYEDKEANLNTKANNLYRLMVKRNRANPHGYPNKSAYNVHRIRGVR